MDIQTRKLNQSAVYWAVTGKDGFNTYTYSAPVEIVCRWSDKTEIVKSSKGEEVVSTAKVFVDRIMKQEDYLQLGDLEVSTPASPFNAKQAYPIIRTDSVPNIKATEVLLSVRL